MLGTVSHTASYLRMWALSLAHQQLALVLFSYTIKMALYMSGPMQPLLLFLATGFWFVATCAILLGIDTMECCLHTLRLHWVEFQSKFYKADGHLFAPYKHTSTLAAEE